MKNELLDSIEGQFIQLNFRWQVFLQLYDVGEESINLLNNSGSNVFALFQKLLIDDTMSALCRLTDSANFGKSKNASIQQLLENQSTELKEDLRSELQVIFSEIKKHMENIRLLRNKAMSHSNLEHSLGIELLPRVTYNYIENSIAEITKLLNKLTGNHSNYTPHIPYGTDGNKLLSVLAKAHGKG
jgi:hypothetical protein